MIEQLWTSSILILAIVLIRLLLRGKRSARLQNADRLRYVLAHEEAHLRHGDPFWSLVRCACLVIWWFHPLVWLAAVLSRRDCELAADEAAVRRLGEAERLAYGRTLLDMVAQKPAPGTLLQTATTMHAGSKDLRTRITRIASARPMKAWALVLALLLAAIAAGCVFTGTQGAASDGEMEAPEGELQAQRQDTPVEADSEGEPDVADPEYAWRRYPGEYAGDYSDLHVEDAQGNDVSAQLIDLWYAASAVYNVDDHQMFDLGEQIYNYNYVELKDYEQVVSAIFTEAGREQLELTFLEANIPLPLLLQENEQVYRKTGWKTGYFYGAALKDMTVLTAEEDRLTVAVTYQHNWGLASPDPNPTYDTLEWVVVWEDALWKVDGYPYPEQTANGMLYAVKGTYTDETGSQYHYSYVVPLVQGDTEGAQAISQKIRDGMGAKVAKALATKEAGLGPILKEVSYHDYGYQFVQSLVLKSESYHEFTDYAVYHYDQETGKELTNAELLKKLGIPQETYLEALRKAAEREFLESIQGIDIEILGGQEFYDEQYAFTMSEDNLNLDTMIYWDSSANGLCAIVPIGAFAGASWYYHVLTVDVAAGNHIRVFREPEEIFVYPYSEEELEAALTAAGEGATEIADKAGTASFERKILTFDPMLTDIHVRQKIAASPVDGWTEADYYAHNISFTLIYSAAYGHDDTFLSDAEDAVIGIHLYREDIQSPWVLETMGVPTADYSYAIQNREDLAQFEAAGKRILAGYQPAEQEYWLYVLDLETETVSYKIRR